HAEDDGPAADEAPADDGGVAHAGLGLLGGEALVIGDAVLEAERVARDQVGEPLLETVLVEQLLDALGGGQIEMPAAGRLRGDVEPGDLLLDEDRRFALRAGRPQPFGDAPPRALFALALVSVGVHAPSSERRCSTVYDTEAAAARQGLSWGVN